MIKLVATDIDGTLLNPQGIITERSLRAIRAALQRDFNTIREPASWSVADAFQAAVRILKEQGREDVLHQAYENALKDLAGKHHRNRMKEIYDQVSEEDLLKEIAVMLTPPGLKAEFQVVYQTMPALRQACPEHTGDWYFTGDYPTPGGVLMANRALVYYMENRNERAY